MNKNFDFICRVLGWGDPQRGIWFIGMEEATKWCSELQISQYRNRNSLRRIDLRGETAYIDSVDPANRYEHHSGGSRRKQIMNMQTRISMPLSEAGPKVMEEYREQRLWCDNSGVFQSNIFPLGKPKVRDPLPKEYKTWFGYGPSDHEKYVRDTKLFRFDLIRRLRETYKPQVIVCFGKSFWHHAAEIFELREITTFSDNLGFFERERVVLTPFLGQGMSCDQATTVAQRLKQWGVRLP